jgi:hypothetical protein
VLLTHPCVRLRWVQDFFGGIVIYTAEQLLRVNGFGTQFWGWGREDDNMRERLVRAGAGACGAAYLF